MPHTPRYYHEYLALDEILNAQRPASFENGHPPAHDEMLFIVIHQSYELWFKQMLFEVESVAAIFNQPAIDDNSEDLQTAVHRLNRVVTILRLLVQQMDVMETMTSMDFLSFRDLLRPASGFQSWQFKVLEARLGLHFEHRHGQDYYTSQLKPEDIARIRRAESEPSLLRLVVRWLERMPFPDTPAAEASAPLADHPFWSAYAKAYSNSLSPEEQDNVTHFRSLFMDDPKPTGTDLLSARARRSALFIQSYRGYPMLELPFQLLTVLTEIDNQMAAWRGRHLNMVRRMIGTRVGTGGSTGARYLQGAMEQHYVFRDIARLSSFLIERRRLPELPDTLRARLGFQPSQP